MSPAVDGDDTSVFGLHVHVSGHRHGPLPANRNGRTRADANEVATWAVIADLNSLLRSSASASALATRLKSYLTDLVPGDRGTLKLLKRRISPELAYHRFVEPLKRRIHH